PVNVVSAGESLSVDLDRLGRDGVRGNVGLIAGVIGDGRLGHPSPTVSLPPSEDPRRERRDDLASEWHTRPQLAEPCRRERRENAARGNVLERGGRVGGPGDQ